MSASVRPAPPPAAFEPISRSNPDAPVRIDVAMPRGLYDRLTRHDTAPRSRYDVATGRAEYVAEPGIAHPGEPLVDTERFLDSPPASRNEALASLLRRFDICEERGSGIDKVVAQVEAHQLPAPLFEAPPGFTRVVLFGRKPMADMDRAERMRACYLHACLKYVTRDS